MSKKEDQIKVKAQRIKRSVLAAVISNTLHDASIGHEWKPRGRVAEAFHKLKQKAKALVRSKP